MRFFKIAFLAVCCLLLSACSSFQPNLTDLMQSPKLTEEQAEIYEALTNAADVSDVQLKYPKSGITVLLSLCLIWMQTGRTKRWFFTICPAGAGTSALWCWIISRTSGCQFMMR